MTCGCVSSAQLCNDHRRDRFQQLRGCALRRADEWVSDLRRRGFSTERWPVDSHVVLDIARMKVADLASDPQLRELLALEAARWCAERWSHGGSVEAPTTRP